MNNVVGSNILAEKIEKLGAKVIGENIVQLNNLSEETLDLLETSFEEFVGDFANFYNTIADSNADFIQKNPIESLVKTIGKGDAIFTLKLVENNQDKKYEIAGFAKISAYANTPDGVECEIDASEAVKIVEVGNLMTKPGFTGHGIATKGVLQCLAIAKQKYPDFYPIAVVHTKNYPSLGVFGKFVKMNQATLLQNWPQWVAHSDHEGIVYTDDMEVCFDLYQVANNLTSINNILNNTNHVDSKTAEG